MLFSTQAAMSSDIANVRVLTPDAVRPVLDEPSRGAPAFALDADGRMTVTTTERLAGPRDGLRRVMWRWDGTRFHRRPG